MLYFHKVISVMGGGDFKQRMSIVAKLAGNATELSRKTGISRRAIGTYLSGCSDPTRERLIAIANASGVTVEWLATGLGNKPCALKEPAMGSAEEVRPASVKAETPLPLYIVASHEFHCCDGGLTETDEVLYLRAETLSGLPFSDLSNLKAIYIEGERVMPLGVGHTVVVDFNFEVGEVFEAGVYLLRKNGEVRASVVYPNGSQYIRYINFDDDTTETFDPSRTDIKIIGRVIWSCGRV